MNKELILAIIARLRATTAIATPLAVVPAGAAATGARIFQKAQVPSDAYWPRCYVGLRRPTSYVWGNARSGIRDRHVTIDVLFATTLTTSPTANIDLETFDALAFDALNMVALGVTDLVWFRRLGDEPIRPQADERNTYLMGGGFYDAFFQHN